MRCWDWDRRLDAHLKAALGRPFSWGEHDCALFAANAVRDMTGIDGAAPFRGRYRTARGATLALRRFAGGGLAEAAAAICATHGWPAVPVTLAQRGDLVLLDTAEGPALGLVDLTGRQAVKAGQDGLQALPLDAPSVLKAWSIG
jgi:hypothetical protein